MNPDFDRAKQWMEALKREAPYRYRAPAMVGGFEDLSRDAQVRDLASFKTYAIDSIAGWWTTEDDADRRLFRHRLHSSDGYLYEMLTMENILFRYWLGIRQALIISALAFAPALLTRLNLYRTPDIGANEWRQGDLDYRSKGATFVQVEASLTRIVQLVVILQQFEREDLLGLD
jgi:hypothetical protein